MIQKNKKKQYKIKNSFINSSRIEDESYKDIYQVLVQPVSQKELIRTADCDTIFTIYLSLCTQSAVRTLFDWRADAVTTSFC